MVTSPSDDMAFWKGIGRVISSGVAQSLVTGHIAQCHPSRSLSSERLSFSWNEAYRIGADHARIRALSVGEGFSRSDAVGAVRHRQVSCELRSLLRNATSSGGGKNVRVPNELVAKVCVQLLCQAGESFHRAESKSNGVSGLPVGFLRSVADRVVKNHPESVDKRAVLKCTADEVIHHGNQLSVDGIAFIVACIVGSGYRDSLFLTRVRCMTSNRLSDWMKDLKRLNTVLRCFSVYSKRDYLMLSKEVSKSLSPLLTTCKDSFPTGLGPILRELRSQEAEIDSSLSQQCLAVLEKHYQQLICEDLVGVMSFLMRNKTPPSGFHCKAVHQRIMQRVGSVHWGLVRDALVLTWSVCETHPHLTSTFDKEGVFDTLHRILERRADEMSALSIAQCVAHLHFLGRPSPRFLSAASRVLIKQKDKLTNHISALVVCTAYAFSRVPQRSDVVAAVGGKLWSELGTLTSEQVVDVLGAFWKVSLQPLFMKEKEETLLRSSRELSEDNCRLLHFFLMDLRMESKALAQCLLLDLVEKLDRSTEFVPMSSRLAVVRYATLCKASLLPMAPYFTGDFLEGET